MFENAREESTTVRLLRDVGVRLRTAVGRSQVGTLLGVPTAVRTGSRRSAESDDSARTRELVPARLEFALADSRIGTIGTRANAWVRSASSSARLMTVGRALRRYVTGSFLYRWLTTEPEPEVIVIDLRETRTVGPFIAALDRALRNLTTATPTSAVADTAAGIGALVRQRPIAAASGLALPALALSFVALAVTAVLTLPLFVVHLLGAALIAIGLRSKRSLEDLRETRVATILRAAFEPPEPPERAAHEYESGSGPRADEHTDDGDRERSTETAGSDQ